MRPNVLENSILLLKVKKELKRNVGRSAGV